MTALPAYPVSKVGRSSLRVLLILLAVTIMQYQDKYQRIIRCEQFWQVTMSVCVLQNLDK